MIKGILILILAAFTATCSVGCSEQSVSVSGTGSAYVADDDCDTCASPETASVSGSSYVSEDGSISCPAVPPTVINCSTQSQIDCVCKPY